MIAVTGANGFIGKEFIKYLSKKNEKIHCLVLEGEDTKELKSYGVEIIYGDILNEDIALNFIKGSRLVVHLAAVVISNNSERLHKVNVEGTRNIVKACKENKIKRIIFTSSIAAVAKQLGPYGKSKLESEILVKESGLSYTILRPTLVYGKKGLEFNEMVGMIKKLPVIPLIGGAKGKKNLVYVEDLAKLMVKIIYSKKAVNKTYELGGAEKISFAELVDTISKELGITRSKIYIPSFISLVIAALLKKIFKNPPLTKDQVIAFGNDAIADMTSLRKDFDFKPISLVEGLKRSIAI